jgi:hypothetical protein
MATQRLRRATPSADRSARLPAVDERQLTLPDPVVQALWQRITDESERCDRRTAEDLWDQGHLLEELAARTGSREEVLRRFPEGPEAAAERMRIAHATSRWLAGVYGLARLRLGLRLMDHLGVDTLDQLECVDLPVAGPDGKATRFPATRELLERALAALDPPRR